MKPMLPLLPLLVTLTALAAPARAADPAPDVARLLADADRFRMVDDDLVVETRVTTTSPDKERLYTVYAQSGRRSLVVMRSPAEQGQKVLMLGDDFWLLMPGTQRPMRITPMQKLLGDASTGDIATLRWSQDYAATLVGAEPCAEDAAPSAPAACWHLSLAAQRKGTSYARIELWLGRTHHEPVRADLYVQSDKRAKQARFLTDRPERPTRIDAMELIDALGHGRRTRIEYLSRQARRVPESWLNPMALVRNPTLE
ncbi:hypothetical protein X805_10170 [Sphaerotilus natans subsp. natans DSM 6575]|uniref:Uncharacterized protein TP-0789 domain-containing protein n=1 Tax=Sphaerotilus natans subsp. natans DSM 6575 TaxID=1286631 RepID=A0A059KPK9_9BURK|nr:outer membrane lipoprotein-sorting protein [Sphaerotilus natans]KDB53432.1 hypothetical protein X805_10170 [Sphaerotilus natans subsp. natans DSM 6575]SIR27301.1 outer membrane lipoprotein-sorting protein [Sphaerotilus natans]